MPTGDRRLPSGGTNQDTRPRHRGGLRRPPRGGTARCVPIRGGRGGLTGDTADSAPGDDLVQAFGVVEGQIVHDRAHFIPRFLLDKERRVRFSDVANLDRLVHFPEPTGPVGELGLTVSRHLGSGREVHFVAHPAALGLPLRSAVPLAEGVPDAIHRPRPEVLLPAISNVALAKPSGDQQVYNPRQRRQGDRRSVASKPSLPHRCYVGRTQPGAPSGDRASRDGRSPTFPAGATNPGPTSVRRPFPGSACRT